jgi:hypothetical protein
MGRGHLWVGTKLQLAVRRSGELMHRRITTDNNYIFQKAGRKDFECLSHKETINV